MIRAHHPRTRLAVIDLPRLAGIADSSAPWSVLSVDPSTVPGTLTYNPGPELIDQGPPPSWERWAQCNRPAAAPVPAAETHGGTPWYAIASGIASIVLITRLLLGNKK
jgi:hypothetical protein